MKGDDRHERAEWHRIQGWDKLGEDAASFKKGAHICVEGEVLPLEYATDKGVKVRSYDIVASSIINLRPGQRYNTRTPSW